MRIVQYTPTAYEVNQNRVPVSLSAPPWADDSEVIDLTERRKPEHHTARKQERADRRTLVMDAIRNIPAGEWFTARQIAKAMRQETSQISGSLRNLVQRGTIEARPEYVNGTMTSFYRLAATR